MTHIARADPADIMSSALAELAAWVPVAKGLDPASRASLYRSELERRMLRARRALKEAGDAG